MKGMQDGGGSCNFKERLGENPTKKVTHEGDGVYVVLMSTLPREWEANAQPLVPGVADLVQEASGMQEWEQSGLIRWRSSVKANDVRNCR